MSSKRELYKAKSRSGGLGSRDARARLKVQESKSGREALLSSKRRLPLSAIQEEPAKKKGEQVHVVQILNLHVHVQCTCTMYVHLSSLAPFCCVLIHVSPSHFSTSTPPLPLLSLSSYSLHSTFSLPPDGHTHIHLRHFLPWLVCTGNFGCQLSCLSSSVAKCTSLECVNILPSKAPLFHASLPALSHNHTHTHTHTHAHAHARTRQPYLSFSQRNFPRQSFAYKS